MEIEKIALLAIAPILLGFALPIFNILGITIKHLYKGVEFTLKLLFMPITAFFKLFNKDVKPIHHGGKIRPLGKRSMTDKEVKIAMPVLNFTSNSNMQLDKNVESASNKDSIYQRVNDLCNKKNVLKGSINKDISIPIEYPICLNNENKGIIQLKNLEQLIKQVSNPTKKALITKNYSSLNIKMKAINLVIHKIAKSNKPIKHIYDLVLEYDGTKYQYDHIILSNKGIYVVDSSSITNNIFIDDEGSFFNMTSGESKIPMESPILMQKSKTTILKKILIKSGIECTIPLYSAVVIPSTSIIAMMSSKIKDSKVITGFYSDCTKFINSIECTTEPPVQVNRIGYYLSEANKAYNMDVLEDYDLSSSDFKHSV